MLAAALAFLGACTKAEEATYEQYNADDNSVEIEVGVETRYVTADSGTEEEVETVSTPLTSSTGSVEVGMATVSPSAGPIGTIHTVSVELYDDYAADVDRVTVRTDSGDRGEDEYDLDRDSAGEGYWQREIQSVGEDGEVRTDTLTFFLYQEVESDEE